MRTLLLDIVRVAPSFAVAWHALRYERSMTEVLEKLVAPARTRCSLAERMRIVCGARWFARLLPLPGFGICLLQSLALFHALHIRGWPVVFVTGVRRSEGGVAGHAWVELDGVVLPELDEPFNRQQYAVSFVFPVEERAQEPWSPASPDIPQAG